MTSPQTPPDQRLAAAQPPAIPELVAQVYEIAPPIERRHMLEQLLQPLGLLSLVAVAHGIFAGIRFRSGLGEMLVPIEELSRVHGSDVVALVEHAQQVSVEAVDGLAQMLMASPPLAASAAGALLVALLVERSRRRQPKPAGSDRLTLSEG